MIVRTLHVAEDLLVLGLLTCSAVLIRRVAGPGVPRVRRRSEWSTLP